MAANTATLRSGDEAEDSWRRTRCGDQCRTVQLGWAIQPEMLTHRFRLEVGNSCWRLEIASRQPALAIQMHPASGQLQLIAESGMGNGDQRSRALCHRAAK